MSIEKILGKYTIIDELAPNRFEVEYNSNSYIIEKYKKNNDSEIYSNTARNLSSVTHFNISSLMLEEDNNNFYFVNHDYSKEDGQYQILSSNCFKDRYGELSYSRLVKCYTQICSAIKYIHEKGFYHGNINPNNIIIDKNENVYLLDFGRSYLYNDISNNKEKTFLAPEQIKENETCNESDIFSFGLCVLKLLADNYDGFNFEEEYNTFEDLSGIFEKLKGFLDDKKRSIDATILLWCKSMLEIEPEKRIDLIKIDQNFNKLLGNLISESSYYSSNTFLIRLSQKILDNYSDYGCYDAYGVTSTIQENIEGKASYWYFEEDRKGKPIIRILSGDYIFYCSADNENENEYPFSNNRKVDCLFCFTIHETKSNRGDDEKSHLERYGNKCNCELKLFDKTTARQVSREEYDNVWDFVDRIKSQYENKLKIEKLNEINKEAIDSEEELLRAEKKVLDSKKITAKVICKSIDKGRDEVSFELENYEEETATKSNFQIGQNVIISEFNNSDNEIKGIISNCYNLKIDVKLEKYKTNEFNESNYVNKEFLMSYDYQIEEIILGKQNRALKELLKGNSYIPNFYRKICNPNDFIKNELIDIDTYSNIKLDGDQKEAIRKGLSIDEGCEILAIQGPPGTGKTTVITEIIEQYLRQKKQDRILVASQSNQAVDNVLKHIIEDKVEVDKITRVGEAKKMTDEAKQYSPEKVLNTKK